MRRLILTGRGGGSELASHQRTSLAVGPRKPNVDCA